MEWLNETLFNIWDLPPDYVILDLKGQAMPAVSSTLTTPLSPRLEHCSKAGSGLLGRSAPEGLLNSSHPIGWLFYCSKGMKTEQENAEAMLDFWGELYDMAMRRGDQEALRNIPTDIYMLLGMRVKSGFADEFEENGSILSEGCGRAFDPIALDG